MVSGLYAGDGLLGGLDGIVDVYYTKVAQADRPLLQQAAGDVLLDLVNDPGGVNDQDFRTVKQMIFLWKNKSNRSSGSACRCCKWNIA